MKTVVFWTATLAIFGVTNGMISRKEAAIRAGTTLYLKLAPRDPRSLMQGDYMVLRYELARDANERSPHEKRRRGRLVVRLDERRVARFVRMFRNQPLADDEHLLRYRRRHGVRIGAESFFFQEGHAQHYNSARYAELKVAHTGECVLTALRKQDLSPCEPP